MESKKDKDDMALTCWERVKAEFQCQNKLLDHHCPELFHRAQCGFSVWYLVWRHVWMVYHVSIIPATVHLFTYHVPRGSLYKWVIYNTHWALVLLAVYAILDFVICFYVYCKRRRCSVEKDTMPVYSKIFWVVANISNTIGIFVGLMYWCFLHNYDKGFDVLSFLAHGMTILYIFLNLLVTAMPVRLFHFYQPMAFLAIYLVFNAVYVVSGGTDEDDKPYIYFFLNWKSSPWQSTGMAIWSLLVTIVAHTVSYIIYLLRISIFKIVCSSVQKRFGF